MGDMTDQYAVFGNPVANIIIFINIGFLGMIFEVIRNRDRIQAIPHRLAYPQRRPYITVRKDSMHMKITFQRNIARDLACFDQSALRKQAISTKK